MHHPTDRITHTTAFVTPVVPFDGVCSTPLATPDEVQLTELAPLDVDVSLCLRRVQWRKGMGSLLAMTFDRGVLLMMMHDTRANCNVSR